MSDLALLHIALLAFVGGHLLLSHPLRAPIVGVAGAGGFMGIYSVVALGSLIWAVNLWRAVPADRLWEAPDALRWAGVVLMLLASILFVGSVAAPNPAMAGPAAIGSGPRGVQRITRHPMMWAFALWGIVHIALSADSRTIALAGGITILALAGSALQDGKKRSQDAKYGEHMARTSFFPFAGQLTGRLPWAGPGLVAGLGGVVLWVILLGAHPHVIGVSPLPM